MAETQVKAEVAVARIARLCDSSRKSASASRQLTTMLNPSARVYRGLSATDTDWVRGNLFDCLSRIPVLPGVVNAALDELRFGHSPISLAGAARALSAHARIADPVRQAALAARSRIAPRDVFPDFAASGTNDTGLTAAGEIDQLLESLPTTPCSCTDKPPSPDIEAQPVVINGSIGSCRFQDQNANSFVPPADVAAVFALFYTRCINPLKCSATVSRLGRAAEAAPELGWYGLSYDPAFDTAQRLHAYGADRGVTFTERLRLLRCTRGWATLRKSLGLQVGYGESTINAHARELFLALPNGPVWRLPPDWLTEPDRIAAFISGVAEKG